jgi:CubicO group peptidase (beta-lactamase class C family)
MRRLLPIALAVSLAAGTLLHAADDLVLSRFADYLESLRVQAGIPGLAATIVSAGDVRWERAFGVADVDRNAPARTDTPFHLDGTTQLITAAMVLRCVEEGRLSLDDAAQGGTIRDLLSHSTPGAGGPSFSYRLDRLNPLAAAIARCQNAPFVVVIGDLFDRLAMVDAVPGADALTANPAWTAATRARFGDILGRLAKPYAIDTRNRPALSQYPAQTLTPGSGAIASARDLAQFDLALKKGVLMRIDSLQAAWTPPADATGRQLPHGLGWFVQGYAGERIVWQFGVGDNASSSLVLTVPGRGLTLILLANSQGLSRPFSLASGDVTVSPFARLFLSVFVR